MVAVSAAAASRRTGDQATIYLANFKREFLEGTQQTAPESVFEQPREFFRSPPSLKPADAPATLCGEPRWSWTPGATLTVALGGAHRAATPAKAPSRKASRRVPWGPPPRGRRAHVPLARPQLRLRRWPPPPRTCGLDGRPVGRP